MNQLVESHIGVADKPHIEVLHRFLGVAGSRGNKQAVGQVLVDPESGEGAYYAEARLGSDVIDWKFLGVVSFNMGKMYAHGRTDISLCGSRDCYYEGQKQDNYF